MEKCAPSDPELLAEWLGQQREAAFHALVGRYAGLVQATAMRTCRDDAMAAEASQLTFIALARKAKSLASCSSLGGWLHLTAMMQAKNLLRKSQREIRKRQLLQAAMETDSAHSSDDVWKEMQPVLDEALAALSEKDREALLLRFYRSLTIREVAATLGIATDAAQKRIERATERLRGKLARRGCLAGGSLSAAMVAGFPADAQAAAPMVFTMADQAISAATPGSGVSISALLISMLAKPTSIASGSAILLVAVTWFGWHSAAVPTVPGASIEKRLADRLAVRVAIRNARGNAHNDALKPIDWRAVGMRMLAARNSQDQEESTRLWNEISPRLSSMSATKLSASLDEITRLGLTADCLDLLEELLLDSLRPKDPMRVLTHHFQTVSQPKWISGSPFPMALLDWAEDDPYAAAAWLDEQISLKTLDRVIGDDGQTARLSLEVSVVKELIRVDFAAAGLRLHDLSADQRALVLARLTPVVREQEQSLYADFVRNHLAEKERPKAISAPIKGMEFEDCYAPISGYLERIDATMPERTACIETAASERFLQIATVRDFTRSDFDELREWISAWVPAETNRITGEMLAKAIRYGGLAAGRLSFEDAAALAVRYQESSGDDEVLVGFLKRCGRGVEPLAGSLAVRISDETKRREVLQLLDQRKKDEERIANGRIFPELDPVR